MKLKVNWEELMRQLWAEIRPVLLDVIAELEKEGLVIVHLDGITVMRSSQVRSRLRTRRVR